MVVRTQASDPSLMQVLIAPSLEPVSIDELARNLRLFTGEHYDGAERDLLQGLLSAARADAEHYTGRYLANCTLRQYFAGFAPCLSLHPDVQQVQAIGYWDSNQQAQSYPLAQTRLVANQLHTNISPVPAAVWVDYTAGMNPLPANVKQALLLMASHWYENREASSPLQVRDVPFAYRWLLDAYRQLGMG